ncbi:MAG: alpha/beta fold hydrolase [Chlamydiia bacterium]|nr:alpha/beta fold hydrolase [Chlamydiia bacterium]
MPKISVNGTDLYYERHGKGIPFILICGFTNTLEMWEGIAPQLKDHFEVITFDNRGSGRSGVTAPPYTIDLLADDVIGLMDALEIQKSHLMGSSMGTTIVQTLGLRYPERLLKGVLLAPFNAIPNTVIRVSKTITKLLEFGVKLELVIETVIPWLFSNTFLSDSNRVEQMISDMVNNPFPQTPEGYAGQLAALAAFDLTDKLPEIETEMLIMPGEEDLFTPLRCAKILEERLPNGKLFPVPKVGHMLHIEAVETVMEETLAFCKAK